MLLRLFSICFLLICCNNSQLWSEKWMWPPFLLKELYVNEMHEKGLKLSAYELKNYGNYGINDTMPVCFIATNHTSGGSSGSPVFNAEGCLIGINFDRNWEGTVSDYIYDPEICRNISLDVRYMLFIIDKYAGAGYLLNEMALVY